MIIDEVALFENSVCKHRRMWRGLLQTNGVTWCWMGSSAAGQRRNIWPHGQSSSYCWPPPYRSTNARRES